jgi:hypothetical protein
MRMRATALLFAMALPMPSAFCARSTDLTISPQQCVWRSGDSSDWSAPSLDETSWQPYAPSQQVFLPRAWIRCHANLSSITDFDQPALQVRLYAAYEIYVDGRLIGTSGDLRAGSFRMNLIQQWPLPRDLPQTSTIALRSSWHFTSAIPFGPYPSLELRAGSGPSLLDQRSTTIITESKRHLIPAICFCIVGILGFIVLGLWLNDPSRRELHLLGINCIALPPIYLNYLGAAALLSYPVSAYFIVWAVPAFLTNICRTLFFFQLARRRVPFLIWALIILATAIHLISFVVPILPPLLGLRLDALRSGPLGAISQFASVLESSAPFFAFLPWRHLSRRMKPLAALCMVWGVTMMLFFFVRFTSARVPGLPDLQRQWSNPVSDFEAIATLGVLVALLTLLFREQQQVARERAILAGELQAAQQVQQLLAPSTLDTLPGMRLAVAFHPVREVGGDFYNCSILPGKRQRIVIGDVSGKGAAAAMTAAVLLGAAQRREDESPSALLRHLNLVMANMRVSGFATCLCAEISADGALTLANAGHLAPYCSGQELSILNGLPLGITPEADYAETVHQLVPGALLTFLSDGVVEARNLAGELFGFDRAAAISTQTAESIASTVLAFGQEDDVTVVTLSLITGTT